MNSVGELKQRLVEVWNSLQQNVINVAISEWRKQLRACVQVDNILNIYCERLQCFDTVGWAAGRASGL